MFYKLTQVVSVEPVADFLLALQLTGSVASAFLVLVGPPVMRASQRVARHLPKGKQS